jgi:hypothetical protein
VGYQRTRKVYRLEFEDGEFEGLEVKMGSLNTREFLDIVALADSVQGKNPPGDAVRSLFESTAAHLISWNVEDDIGEPVPATVDGLFSQDLDLVMAVILAWQKAVGGVSGPLPQSSNGGGQFREASLPMEPWSPSRSS